MQQRREKRKLRKRNERNSFAKMDSNECGKERDLNDHKENHVFEYMDCEKVFKRKNELMEHIPTHVNTDFTLTLLKK